MYSHYNSTCAWTYIYMYNLHVLMYMCIIMHYACGWWYICLQHRIMEMTVTRGCIKNGLLRLWSFRKERGEYFKDYAGKVHVITICCPTYVVTYILFMYIHVCRCPMYMRTCLKALMWNCQHGVCYIHVRTCKYVVVYTCILDMKRTYYTLLIHPHNGIEVYIKFSSLHWH